MAEHAFIDTVAEVEELAAKLALEKVVAVDTEADSFFHYFDKLAWCRSAPRAGTSPDRPARGAGRARFDAARAGVRRSGDPEGLPRGRVRPVRAEPPLLPARAEPVRHDDLGAAHGYPAVGYAALVERHFDVRLSKDQQRTDWSRRPLKDVPARLRRRRRALPGGAVADPRARARSGAAGCRGRRQEFERARAARLARARVRRAGLPAHQGRAQALDPRARGAARAVPAARQARARRSIGRRSR